MEVKRAIRLVQNLMHHLKSVESVINELKIAEFLDLKTSKIKLHNRFQSPIAERAAHTGRSNP
jgi:hypothetical protein